MSEHLEEQAAGLGIDLGFHDIGGIYHAAKPEVLEGIIKALQQDGFSDDLYAVGNLCDCLLSFMARLKFAWKTKWADGRFWC